MSAVLPTKRRLFRGQWTVAIAVVFVAGVGLGAWRYFWVPPPAAPDPSTTFRDLSTILAEYAKNGWECAMGPEGVGPFRSPVDCKGYSLLVGIETRFKYRNEFGEIDVTVPGSVDRGYFIAPLETADGRLTYMILEKKLPPDNLARQLAEKAMLER
jgi:hypothetical protein